MRHEDVSNCVQDLIGLGDELQTWFRRRSDEFRDHGVFAIDPAGALLGTHNEAALASPCSIDRFRSRLHRTMDVKGNGTPGARLSSIIMPLGDGLAVSVRIK